MPIQTLTLANTYFEWLTTTNQIITNLNLDVASLAYAQANIAPNIANSYTITVGTAGNNYTREVGTASNTYARTVGTASNTYAETVGTAGNNYTQTANNFAVAYAQTIVAAGNNYTREVGTAGNNYTLTVATAGNNYAITIGTAGNNYTRTVGDAANTQASSALAVGQGAFVQANTARSLANTSLQNNKTTLISVGYTLTPYNAGTKSGGATFTPDPEFGNYQYYTNGGAHTLAAPATDCAIDILVTNGATAGAITYSGFTYGSSVGDDVLTTNGYKYLFSIRRINSVATFMVKALQ